MPTVRWFADFLTESNAAVVLRWPLASTQYWGGECLQPYICFLQKSSGRAQGEIYLCSDNIVTQQQGSSLRVLPTDTRLLLLCHKTTYSSTPRQMLISQVTSLQIQRLPLKTPTCLLYTLQATVAHTTHRRTPTLSLKPLQSHNFLMLILLSPRSVQLSFFRKFNQVPYSLITEIKKSSDIVLHLWRILWMSVF
jgi:hypothetical protein